MKTSAGPKTNATKAAGPEAPTPHGGLPVASLAGEGERPGGVPAHGGHGGGGAWTGGTAGGGGSAAVRIARKSYLVLGMLGVVLFLVIPFLEQSETAAALFSMAIAPLVILPLLAWAVIAGLICTLIARRDRSVRRLAAVAAVGLLATGGMGLGPMPIASTLALEMVFAGASALLVVLALRGLVGPRAGGIAAWCCGLPLAVAFGWSAAAPLVSGKVESGRYLLRSVPWTMLVPARTDIFAREAGGGLDYLGSTGTVGPVFVRQFGLESGGLAIAEDGEAIVFRHVATLGPGFVSRESGLYRHSRGGGLVLVHPERELGTRWSLPDDTLPAGVLVFDLLPADDGVFDSEYHEWALHAQGGVEPLALLGGAALHEAAWRDDAAAVEGLVEEGAALEARTHWKHTALEIALARRKEDAAVTLIQHGAELTAFGQHAFVTAAELGLLRVLEAIVARPADTDPIRAHGEAAWTAATKKRLATRFDPDLFGRRGVDALDDSRERVALWLREHGVQAAR